MVRRASGAISIVVATALGGVLLYFSLRGIEWRQIGRIISGANVRLLAAAASFTSVTLFLRACRWRVLLQAEGPVGVSTAFWATAAGYFGNNFLPARAGELVRTYMVAGQSPLQTAYVLATALFERVADAIVLVGVSAIVALTLTAQPGWLYGAARTFASLGLLAAVGVAVLPFFESHLSAIIGRAPVSSAWRVWLTTTMGHGLRGLRAFHDPRRLSTFLGFTVVIWCLDAVGTIAGARALGLHMAPAAAFLLLAGLGLGSALPSTPGYVGIYQFVAVSVLVPFGFSRTDAVAYIMTAQFLSYVVIGICGGIGLSRYKRARRAA